MSAFDPKRTLGRPHRRAYLFKFFLLGGEPEWQVPHGLPFAIWGVACALDIVSEDIATVIKNTTTAPMTVVTIQVLIAGCNFALQIVCSAAIPNQFD
jgi:hypothetical protein